ncbi:MAG TPA: Do family serine endopeptidase [Candidatus Binatia bacterium]|jgi:Do/DeqQ family serine protease
MNTCRNRRHSRRAFRRCAYAIIAIAAFAVFGCRKPQQPAAVTPPPAQQQSAKREALVRQTSYADIVDRVSPAVVTVHSERRVRAPQQFPFSDDPLLRQFFGAPSRSAPRSGQRVQALGSGVIVRSEGYIVTNHHVVDGAEDIKVELADRRVLDAKVIGSDAPSDIAVMKIDAGQLAALAPSDSDAVRVGDVALAIGNPLGLGETVTAGIISAKGRTTGLSDGTFEDFLQTDAPINRGNSGGALVNANGDLIGINSQIVSPSGGNIGIGFAVPSNMVREVSDQLIKSGKVRRGQLGVSIQPMTPDIAASLGMKEARGVIVNDVVRNGSAEKAGIRRGDVIVAFNGKPVVDGNTLRNQVADTPPGTAVDVTIQRDRREQTLRATLGEYQAREKPAEQG